MNISVKMNYFTETTDGKEPRFIPPTNYEWTMTNFCDQSTLTNIYDLRLHSKKMTLDENGFEVIPYEGVWNSEFSHESEAQNLFFQDISEILKRHLGASNIYVYHYAFRARGKPITMAECDVNHRNPLLYPHVDHDSKEARRRIEQRLGQEYTEKLVQHRHQLINVWKPIGNNPILDKPLALLDYQTVDIEKDVIPLLVGENATHPSALTISRSQTDSHRWYYLSQMCSTEMYLFKIFDSKSDVAKYAFHSAVIDENATLLDSEQKSLEIRCIVLYED